MYVGARHIRTTKIESMFRFRLRANKIHFILVYPIDICA